MTKSITGQALVSSTSNGAGSTTRGQLDVSAADGGQIRWRMTNGATGPTVACQARVLVARKQTSMPTAASEGTADDDWKQVFVQNGSTSANAVSRGQFTFGPEIAYIEIEFTANTGQAVTVECTGDTYTY